MDSFDRLEWTFSKVALTELIYALKAAGVFNHGNADLKTIARHFEKVFGVDLGNYYKNISGNHKQKNRPDYFPG